MRQSFSPPFLPEHVFAIAAPPPAAGKETAQ
jgi:hypothetical protein